jgi:RND family efflux transporter MFP subunit
LNEAEKAFPLPTIVFLSELVLWKESLRMSNEDLAKLKINKATLLPRPARRSKTTVWIVAGLLCILVVSLYLSGVLSPAVTVEVVTISEVYPYQAFTLLNASGYVVAQRKAAVASKTTSRLVWLGVEEGSRVRQGEIIARLEGDDVAAGRNQSAANLQVAMANLEQARAELHDAGRALGRQRELLNQGIVSQADFDVAEARYKKAGAAVSGGESSIKAAQAALRGADVAIEYTLIRAPFDAVVLTKNADVGDIVTPLGAAANARASVVTIADMGSLQVETDVSESNLEKIKPVQPCEIQLDAIPDIRFRGLVHMVVPTADRSKATVQVKVRFVDQDRRILPEMSAMVAFLSKPVAAGERKPKTAVSPAAVTTRGGRKVLYLLKGDQVVETQVTIGSKIGDFIEITGGAKAGDKVVVKPLEKLKNGTKVKVAEK